MRTWTKALCCCTALVLLFWMPGAVEAGKPDKPSKPGKPGNDAPKTQACTLTGEADGSGTVGVDPRSNGVLTVTVLAFVGGQPTELANTFAALGAAGTYVGLGRVLKKQGYLDFYFDIPYDPTCRETEFGDVMGSDEIEADNVCQYHLQLLGGVYYRKGDSVTFMNSEAWLFDNYGDTRELQRLSPDNARANLEVQFE